MQKFEYIWNGLSKSKKQTHSEILFLRAFKWAININEWDIFEKVEILVWTPYHRGINQGAVNQEGLSMNHNSHLAST